MYKKDGLEMYNSSNVAERIKELAKERNVSIKQLLLDVGLGFNTMSNMKTSMPKADNLAKIADYLDCSVDYLLGRTDVPEVNKGNEEPIVYKVAARGGEREITLTAAQRKELAKIIEEAKNDDNSDLV